MPTLYYFHDPMCSWCYALNRVFEQLQCALPEQMTLTKILGGLAPDTHLPMSEASKMAIKNNWLRIEQTVPGTQFNYDFWERNTPFRSTYPACRAVLAAEKQGRNFADKMIVQIQIAYYCNAKNPSLQSTLLECAKRIGLELQLFQVDLNSKQIDNALTDQIQFSRQCGISSFPSLCLKVNKQILPITIDYNQVLPMLDQIFSRCGE